MALVAPVALAADEKRLAAHFTDDPITLDGVLKERAWTEAEAGTAFVQREAETGKPDTERPDYRYVHRHTTLYTVLSANDAEADRIIQKEMQRDLPLWRDDAVDVLLDTFHDHRNAYLFETNVNAARTDALISDEGRDFNL